MTEVSQSKISGLAPDRPVPSNNTLADRAPGVSYTQDGPEGSAQGASGSGRYGELTIDLGAVQRNWHSLRRLLHGFTECGAVVKANAYGLGVGPVCQALHEVGCRRFFVATVDEGIAVRRYLDASVDIYVLGGFLPGGEFECITHRLTPVLFTLEQMRRWCSASARTRSPSAIKVDTGMARLGLDDAVFERLCRERQLLTQCNPVLLMSHLACADEPSHPLNLSQLQCFRQVVQRARALFPDIRLSLANSSGICLGADWHFDLVRPGAALYGVNPQPNSLRAAERSLVEQVVQLHLPIIQVRDIQPGARVGYGATHIVERPSRLAVVMGGYADGIHRTMGNRGYGLLAGIRVPVVGRISMDSTIFDITDVPGELVPVEGRGSIQLLGDGLTVDEVGATAGTIGYEILTSLGDRYRRHYIDSVTR